MLPILDSINIARCRRDGVSEVMVTKIVKLFNRSHHSGALPGVSSENPRLVTPKLEKLHELAFGPLPSVFERNTLSVRVLEEPMKIQLQTRVAQVQLHPPSPSLVLPPGNPGVRLYDILLANRGRVIYFKQRGDSIGSEGVVINFLGVSSVGAASNGCMAAEPSHVLIERVRPYRVSLVVRIEDITSIQGTETRSFSEENNVASKIFVSFATNPYCQSVTVCFTFLIRNFITWEPQYRVSINEKAETGLLDLDVKVSFHQLFGCGKIDQVVLCGDEEKYGQGINSKDTPNTGEGLRGIFSNSHSEQWKDPQAMRIHVRRKIKTKESYEYVLASVYPMEGTSLIEPVLTCEEIGYVDYCKIPGSQQMDIRRAEIKTLLVELNGGECYHSFLFENKTGYSLAPGPVVIRDEEGTTYQGMSSIPYTKDRSTFPIKISRCQDMKVDISRQRTNAPSISDWDSIVTRETVTLTITLNNLSNIDYHCILRLHVVGNIDKPDDFMRRPFKHEVSNDSSLPEECHNYCCWEEYISGRDIKTISVSYDCLAKRELLCELRHKDLYT